MNSKILKILVFSFLILFLFTGFAAAQEWVVTAAGDVDKINTSTINLDQMTLREAIAKAGSGDTIVFAENISTVQIMHGSLNLSKDLTIGGNSKVTVKRDSSPVTQDMTIFTVTGANVIFKQLTIENGYKSDGLGGALYADRANVTFEFCTIQKNKADIGGAIYVANNSYVKLVSTSLYRNNATNEGSAVYIKSGAVELQNTVIDGHSGKYNTILLDQGKIIVSQSRLTNNEITSKGSPLTSAAGTTVEVRNSTFSNNTAVDSAGVTSYGTLLVENCLFDGGKTSGSGGGISLKNGSVGEIKYSIFSNANVSDDGGGVHVDVGAKATIDTCTFVNNLANYGGAFFSRGILDVKSSTAVNNTAKFYGGAAAFWNDATTTMTKTVLAGNTAKSNNTAKDPAGGGLNISGSQATLSNNVIVGNKDPREIDFGEYKADVRSNGNNLVGIYRGDGRYPIDASDAAGILAENVFVMENGLPALTKSTGHTAGADKATVYTVALNSSSDNPAIDVLGDSGVTPKPEPEKPDNPDTNQTPEPEKPESGGLLQYLKYIVGGIVLLIILVIAAVLLWKYNEKRKYKFG